MLEDFKESYDQLSNNFEIEVMNTLCGSKIYGAHHTSQIITLHYIDIDIN